MQSSLPPSCQDDIDRAANRLMLGHEDAGRSTLSMSRNELAKQMLGSGGGEAGAFSGAAMNFASLRDLVVDNDDSQGHGTEKKDEDDDAARSDGRGSPDGSSPQGKPSRGEDPPEAWFQKDLEIPRARRQAEHALGKLRNTCSQVLTDAAASLDTSSKPSEVQEAASAELKVLTSRLEALKLVIGGGHRDADTSNLNEFIERHVQDANLSQPCQRFKDLVPLEQQKALIGDLTGCNSRKEIAEKLDALRNRRDAVQDLVSMVRCAMRMLKAALTAATKAMEQASKPKSKGGKNPPAPAPVPAMKGKAGGGHLANLLVCKSCKSLCLIDLMSLRGHCACGVLP